jgi:hypothetical protein
MVKMGLILEFINRPKAYMAVPDMNDSNKAALAMGGAGLTIPL